MKRCAANIILVVIMIMLLSDYAGLGFGPGPVKALAADTPVVSFVKVNGSKVNFPDGQPIIESGRTLVPVRFIAEALGYEVDWIQETKTVTINNGQILLSIGSNTATVNGGQVAIDVPAKLIVTDGMTRTYVPLRFVSETLNCTVDWFHANRSIVINSLLPDGKEVSLYERCKQSELFYEKLDNENPEWFSELYYKKSLAELTNEACLDAEWVISRRATWYPGDIWKRENGEDITITILEPTLITRREVKDLLMTFYPTGHEEVYDILMKTIREEIFENKGILPGTISGTYGTRYIDKREVHINKLYSTLNVSIQVKDAGYVNPQIPEPYSKEFLESLIADGVANHYSGKWYMDKYELDEW